MSNNVRVPENALIYFFAGEFAKDPKLWLIDLDNGEITQCASDNQAACLVVGTVGSDVLHQLRLSAVTVWQRVRPKGPPLFAPGVVDDSYIVSGKRMASFSPLEPQDKALTDQVEKIVSKAAR